MMSKEPFDPDETARLMESLMDLTGLSWPELRRRLGGDYGVQGLVDESPEVRPPAPLDLDDPDVLDDADDLDDVEDLDDPVEQKRVEAIAPRRRSRG